ncbi:MAG: ORF6N domain-containing protein [Candidatus Uhrbacteria bacterium]|nr:ORF6N domain-containing protein [Candidatus Uhrbacteria bacterium]
MTKSLLPQERIEGRIFIFRGRKVMIDRDLASLYGVTTKAFKQAVRRNRGRFPEDFMFQLSAKEFENWRSQFVTSKSDKMGLRYRPFVFTEQGVAMLSSVLKSKRAINVNIQIMRTFSKLREMLVENDGLRLKLDAMEKRYDEQFKVVFDAIRNLLSEKSEESRTIGFRTKK